MHVHMKLFLGYAIKVYTNETAKFDFSSYKQKKYRFYENQIHIPFNLP